MLKGQHFIVETDHRNITFLRSMPSPKIERWFIRLQEYDFIVRFRPGVKNQVADALSRCFGIHNYSEEEKDAKAKEALKQIKLCHNDLTGHYGVANTMVLGNHFFPKKFLATREMVRNYIRQCPTCQRIKNTVAKSPKLVMSPTSVFEPFEQIQMDFLGPFPPDEEGYTYVLVCVDMFSRYTELFPCKDQRSETVAQCLFQLVCRYGLPRCIFSDNGPSFAGNFMKDFHEMLRGAILFPIIRKRLR